MVRNKSTFENQVVFLTSHTVGGAGPAETLALLPLQYRCLAYYSGDKLNVFTINQLKAIEMTSSPVY